jgi:hypothetical protein
MIIDLLSAAKFIALYKALLLEIDRAGHDGRTSNLIKRLVAVQSRLSSDPSLIEQALAARKSKSVAGDLKWLDPCGVWKWRIGFFWVIPKSTCYSFTRQSIGHTVSWGSTIESEILNSISLFFPRHRGKLVETFYKPVKIEGFIFLQNVKNLR